LRLAPLVVTPVAGTDTMVVSGRIRSSLYAALDSCAEMQLPQRARWKLAWSMADILEYRVDMSRDLRLGDNFRVLVERVLDPTSGVRVGRVLALRFALSRDTLTAFRFLPSDTGARQRAAPTRDAAAGDYFDTHGRSLRAAFLRAPLEFRRIASGFGLRLHPILGIWRNHRGTDYAAALGTPVRAIGDGIVLSAGRRGGYGNMIEIRHPNGYITRYGHLARFAPGIHQGARVEIGKTIAYVGMTGLATGPHLHFEVLVGGTQRDPAVALRDRGTSAPVPAQARPEFDHVVAALDEELGTL
jgi:murein DD-endopeptidase MepM/ murein hydrolase activator NlpD